MTSAQIIIAYEYLQPKIKNLHVLGVAFVLAGGDSGCLVWKGWNSKLKTNRLIVGLAPLAKMEEWTMKREYTTIETHETE